MFSEFRNTGIADLEQTERQQFSLIYDSLWSIYESAYFARGYGTLGESEWTRFRTMMCRQYEDSRAQNYWRNLDMLLSEEFKAYVVSNCAN
jgi:hypothetical protein